jgi:hypothetical protein
MPAERNVFIRQINVLTGPTGGEHLLDECQALVVAVNQLYLVGSAESQREIGKVGKRWWQLRRISSHISKSIVGNTGCTNATESNNDCFESAAKRYMYNFLVGVLKRKKFSGRLATEEKGHRF